MIVFILTLLSFTLPPQLTSVFASCYAVLRPLEHASSHLLSAFDLPKSAAVTSSSDTITPAPSRDAIEFGAADPGLTWCANSLRLADANG